MFVQATKSKRGNKTYVSYLVRESFRTPQGPRSRTVCIRLTNLTITHKFSGGMRVAV
jgi:hypothetical protein